MTASIDLVALSGPLEGSRIELRPDRPLLIGRSFRGVHLADPLVSIEHAEIAWVTDYYWVSDLGSLTGTFLDGERLANDAKPLVPGAILRIGESDFRVVVRRGWPPWAVPLLALLVVLGTVALVLIMRAAKVEVYEPWMYVEAPVLTGQGDPVTFGEGGRLDVPLSFIRKEGADHRHLDLRNFDDYDGDERSDFWLEWRNQDGMYTFDDGGDWKELGRFPKDCVPRQKMPFPELRCDRSGDTWRHDGEQYQLYNQEGVVVWLRLADDPDVEGDQGTTLPIPYRVYLQDTHKLAGFLQARGIVKPVHYLVCEQALAGMQPQVLTGFDEVESLDYGCIGDVGLVFQQLDPALKGATPVAVAFTATGRKALLDDLSQHLFGDDQDLFKQAEARELVPDAIGARLPTYEAFSRVPEWSTQTRLVFNGIELHVDPLAAEEPRQQAYSRLLFDGRGIQPSTPVTTVHVPTFGEDLFMDPPGCERYQVITRDMSQCARRRWCAPGRWFARVDEIGCTEEAITVLEVPYERDLGYARTPRHEIAVQLDRESNSNFIDVLRARVAIRETVKPAPAPEVDEPDDM